jgi:hypothetical protein
MLRIDESSYLPAVEGACEMQVEKLREMTVAEAKRNTEEAKIFAWCFFSYKEHKREKEGKENTLRFCRSF